MRCNAVRSKQQCYLANWLEHVLCVQEKTCKFFLPLSVITQEINLLNGIWWLSNRVGQNSCPLILDNNHCKFSVICVSFMYKYLALSYIFFLFFNPTPFVFLKTFLVSSRLLIFFPFEIKTNWCVNLVRKKRVRRYTKIWLSTAFIVCYKIKHDGFDFHMHSTSLYHPHSALSKKRNPYLPYLLGGGDVTGTRHIFYLASPMLLVKFRNKKRKHISRSQLVIYSNNPANMPTSGRYRLEGGLLHTQKKFPI